GGTWAAPAPTVTSITPDEGSASGGTPVTIAGTGFRAGADVSIGGTPATSVNVVSLTSISATTPAGSVGDADVVAENPDGQSDMLDDGFTYTADPEPLVPGTATLGTVNPYLVQASATAATGGEGTVTQQWQRSPRGAGTWSNLTGQTALALTDRTVTAGTNYDYRLAYSDDNGTEYSNTLQPNVPAAFVSWGVLGDSNTDEYRAESNIGGGTAYAATTLNWLELLADDLGQDSPALNNRGLNFGAWSGTSRGEPRRRGFEYNW